MPPSQVAQKGGPQQASAMPVAPWRVGVYDQETPDYDQTVTMSTSGTVNFPVYTLSPSGWLRGLWFLYECITASNAATVAFTADGPFSAIQKVTFKDVGGREIFGPLGGYDWLTIMKYGGYFEVGDPRSDVVYSATTGAGGTGGSFTMVMYLPLELVDRDGLGDIENKSSSSAFRVEQVLDKTGNVYSTAPTTPGTVRCRITEDGYTEPEAADAMGRPLASAPPASGTIQYWASENATLASGTAKYLVQNGLGYSIRNLIWRLVDSSSAAGAPQGSRANGDANWPDPVTLNFGKVQLFQRYQKLWKSRQAKAFGLTNTTPDASLGLENGVYPWWLTRDFGLRPGAELRHEYLTTKTGNVLQWSGTIGSTGTAPSVLFTAVNYVVPPANDPARLRATR
jgi:hypothetical protein